MRTKSRIFYKNFSINTLSLDSRVSIRALRCITKNEPAISTASTSVRVRALRENDSRASYRERVGTDVPRGGGQRAQLSLPPRGYRSRAHGSLPESHSRARCVA